MEEKFGVILQSSYYVPGDERSRTNPGHGYPAEHVQYTKFIEMKDEEELRRWIEHHERDKYQVIRYSPVTVTKEVKLSFE